MAGIFMIDMLTNSEDVNRTLGPLSGTYLDSSDPDKDPDDENVGARQRRKMYCVASGSEAKLVHLRANMTTSISALSQPFPSNLDIHIGCHLADDTLIITATKENDTTRYRILIAYLELVIKRLIINPKLQTNLEKLWKNNNLRFCSNRDI